MQIMAYKTFQYNSHSLISLVKFCPECGGSLNFDSVTKNFICRGCGLYAAREKFEELHDKLRISEANSKRDEYLDWWQSSKKDKRNRQE